MNDIGSILYGNFMKYDRMYELTKYAFYGKTDSISVNIFIDCYSLVRSLYSRYQTLMIKNSCVIASCLINLAIHLRSYFETRHCVVSKIYLIYGGARPKESFVNYYLYNSKNISMEDYNYQMKSLIMDNMNIINILAPYLYDIFCIIDEENEFSVISSAIIDDLDAPNIIYSKELLSYQLVAFKPNTFLYRVKKKLNVDDSWVVTKSILYDAYRYDELNIHKKIDTTLDPKMFSVYQSICGVKTRSLNAIKNANSTIKILENAISSNIFSNGYNANSILYINPNPFELLFDGSSINPAIVTNRFAAIDLPFQTMIYKLSTNYRLLNSNFINLYDPQEVRNINDKYFQDYPLDLNRV